MLHKKLHNAFEILVIVLVTVTLPVSAKDDRKSPRAWKMEDVLQNNILPFAIGHRGYGENLGEAPEKPIENTAKSVRRAFREGIQIVEVDVVMTEDKRIVALHDDFLADGTCVNTLNFRELKSRLYAVSSLRRILRIGRRFSHKMFGDSPSGQLIIEIKPPSPFCDSFDATAPDLVRQVVKDIKRMNMKKRVLIESFSPEILALVKARDPNIQTMLTLSFLQLLSPEQVEAITGLDVTLIDKSAGFGLQWAEIGILFRLPGYFDTREYIQTLLLTESRAASLDSIVLAQAEQSIPGAGSAFIDQIHFLGLAGLVYTINTESEWLFFSGLGADGIYTDNIPLGLTLEGH